MQDLVWSMYFYFGHPSTTDLIIRTEGVRLIMKCS